MKNIILVFVLLTSIFSFSSCQSRSAQESQRRRQEQKAKAEEVTTVKSISYVGDFEIEVERIENSTKVLRYDSVVTYLPDNTVTHRTLITSQAASN